MSDLNLKKILNMLDSIQNSISIFLDKVDSESSFEDKKDNNYNALRNNLYEFIHSALPSFKAEITQKSELLNDNQIFYIIRDSLISINSQIHAITSNNINVENKLIAISNKCESIYNIRRDFRVINSISSTFNEKVVEVKNELKKEIKIDYKEFIDSIESNFNDVAEKFKRKNEGLFEFYEEEQKKIRAAEFENNNNKREEFNNFLVESNLMRENLIAEFDKSFNQINKDWKKIQQIQTENVYLNAYQKNSLRAKEGEAKFIRTLYISLFISILLIIAYIFKKVDLGVFLTLKIMILIFFGILITYYLKISTHYRRLADQAEQTHLELLAFPQYVVELDKEKANQIKEQLALKYFGKEIDPSGYQKIGEIAQEQLKTSSELVKAAASITQGAGVKNQNTNSNPPAANGGEK